VGHKDRVRGINPDKKEGGSRVKKRGNRSEWTEPQKQRSFRKQRGLIKLSRFTENGVDETESRKSDERTGAEKPSCTDDHKNRRGESGEEIGVSGKRQRRSL